MSHRLDAAIIDAKQLLDFYDNVEDILLGGAAIHAGWFAAVRRGDDPATLGLPLSG
ncbi:MAG TPA: hypothetical protein VEX68_19700 [Bryobacteraceae bacterium]|nr:hypothetical protein [Bryobacteraceae bacterium]